MLLAIVIPIELAAHVWDFDFHIWDSTLITVLFFLDILFNIYQAKTKKGTYLTAENFYFKRYFRHWFIYDLIAAFPFGLISHSFRIFRLIKLVPVFHKLKLARLRILRFSSQLQLLNMILILFLVTHWIACGWLVVRGFDMSLDLKDNYVNALYWSITTVTTVGYGDVTPVNMLEKIYAMVTMLVGLGIFGFFIGSITSILSKKDPAREHYYQNLEELSQIVKYRSLSPALQKRVHDYYTYKWQKRLGFDEEHFLKGLPPGLKMEVALQLKKDVIESIPLFKDAPQSFIKSIALHLQPIVCTPGDFVFRIGDDADEMYFIVQGDVDVLTIDQQVIASLSDGEFFGEISLFKERTRSASIQAKSYCDFYKLSKRSYNRVISRYPRIAKQIEAKAKMREEKNIAERGGE
jgi:voltage-gated potassium channel